MLEVVKVPLTISESLVKLPTQLIQLKFDYSSKVKDLLTKQAEIEAAQKALAAKPPPTDHEEAIQQLQQQKELLALQKEIADLRSQIEELEKAK